MLVVDKNEGLNWFKFRQVERAVRTFTSIFYFQRHETKIQIHVIPEQGNDDGNLVNDKIGNVTVIATSHSYI